MLKARPLARLLGSARAALEIDRIADVQRVVHVAASAEDDRVRGGKRHGKIPSAKTGPQPDGIHCIARCRTGGGAVWHRTLLHGRSILCILKQLVARASGL